MAQYDHWMKLHIGDYLADTQHLTCVQHGAYLLLIMHYFKRRGLPNDDRELARIVKLPLVVWKRWAAPAVMAFFTPSKKGGWHHTKIERVLREAKSLSAKRADAGKSGASKRWGMANAKSKNGKSHSPARPRARDHTTIAKSQKNPPRSPPVNGGARAAANFKCGFGESAASDMRETIDHAEAADAHPRGATVVPIARRAHRRVD